MDLSFQEKSIWGSLVGVLITFAYYFASAIGMARSEGGASPAELAWLSITVIVALIAIEVIYHVILAIRSEPEPADERDALIEARASQIAYVLLVVCAFVAIGQVIASSLLEGAPEVARYGSPILTAHLVLLAVVVAEVTKFTAQLVYYRRGLQA